MNYKSKYKKIDIDIEENQEINLNHNSICLCCDNETTYGYLFCPSCYREIKNTRRMFDHNRSEKNIQNHYFELRDKIKNDFKNFNDNIQLMFALAEELENTYDNDYLIKRVENDLITAHNTYKENKTKEKEQKLVEEFNDKDIREKWPREYQCADGHYVRSLSEQNIDNWLYNNGYLHAYEKSVYLESNPNAIILCDFYLPKGKIYIEFWGLKDIDEYEKRKAIKIKMYDDNKLNRIDLNEQDIKRLDDILPRLIAKFTKP